MSSSIKSGSATVKMASTLADKAHVHNGSSFQPRIDPVQHRFIQLGSYRINLYLANHFFCKTVGQKILRQIGMNTTSRKIEQLFIINLANSCPMSAFNVIGKDLKLGLGINASFI